MGSFITDCRKQQNSNDKTNAVFLIQYYSLSADKWKELKPPLDAAGQSKENSASFLAQLKNIWDEYSSQTDKSTHGAKSRLGVQLVMEESVIQRLLAPQGIPPIRQNIVTSQSSPGGQSYSTIMTSKKPTNITNNNRSLPTDENGIVEQQANNGTINPRDDPITKMPRSSPNASSTTIGRRYNNNGAVSDSSAYDTAQEYTNKNSSRFSSVMNNNDSSGVSNSYDNNNSTNTSKNMVAVSQEELMSLITLRDQYNTLMNNFVALGSQRDELSAAVAIREAEIDRYRKEKPEMMTQTTDGVRKRTKGSGSSNSSNKDDDGDDMTQMNDGEMNTPGFPLWQACLLAFIMFLLGRLTADIL